MTFSFPATGPARLLLLGMPGSGKSTLGRALAVRAQLPFRDLDDEIEQAAGCSIPTLFATEGEAYFRALEARTLRAVLAAEPRLVLATGGGTPCFHDNLPVLQAAGLTLWLEVPVPELAARLHHAAQSRPLLANAPSAAELTHRLTETLAARQQFYEQAALRCRPPGCTPEAVWQLVQRYHSTA